LESPQIPNDAGEMIFELLFGCLKSSQEQYVQTGADVPLV